MGVENLESPQNWENSEWKMGNFGKIGKIGSGKSGISLTWLREGFLSLFPSSRQNKRSEHRKKPGISMWEG